MALLSFSIFLRLRLCFIELASAKSACPVVPEDLSASGGSYWGESQILFHLFVSHTILPMACPVTNCAMYYVYVLLSEKDERFYTGSTNDLKRRLDEHNAGKVESTKRRKPLKLI
jgi:hypothetical protein